MFTKCVLRCGSELQSTVCPQNATKLVDAFSSINGGQYADLVWSCSFRSSVEKNSEISVKIKRTEKFISALITNIAHILQVCRHGLSVRPWTWYGLPGRCHSAGRRIPGRQRLRSSSTSALDVPSTRLSTVGDRAFPVAAARTWNSLPAEVTSSNFLQPSKPN